MEWDITVTSVASIIKARASRPGQVLWHSGWGPDVTVLSVRLLESSGPPAAAAAPATAPTVPVSVQVIESP
jgi:hypothetical protein